MATPRNRSSDPLYIKPITLQLVQEIDAAERNFDVILMTGREIVTNSLLAKYTTRVHIGPLEALVKFLKRILAIVRREILKKEPGTDVGRGKVAAKGDTLLDPTGLSKCMCPLTVLLQIIVSGLSEVRIGTRPNEWGGIDPLRKQLDRLQSHLKTFPEGNTHPGLAKVIMFHEEHGIFTVASTSPAYKGLAGLDIFCRQARNSYLSELKMKVGAENRNRIESKLKHSERTLNAYNTPAHNGEQAWDRQFNQSEAIHVNGSGATFNSKAEYKIACTLDYCRFSMDRNERGNEEERSATIRERRANAVEACAEWELWLVKLANGPVQPAPKPVYKPKGPGISHANTFPPASGQGTPPAAPRQRSRITNIPGQRHGHVQSRREARRSES